MKLIAQALALVVIVAGGMAVANANDDPVVPSYPITEQYETLPQGSTGSLEEILTEDAQPTEGSQQSINIDLQMNQQVIVDIGDEYAENPSEETEGPDHIDDPAPPSEEVPPSSEETSVAPTP